MSGKSGTSKGHKLCTDIGIVCMCALILLSLLAAVGLSRLPSDEDAIYAAYSPKHDSGFIASVVLGGGYNPNVYAVYSDGRKLVGSSFLYPHEVALNGVFGFRLEPNRYVFTYSKESILRLVYKRTSLLERFTVSLEEMGSTSEVLSMITEGERRMEQKKRELQEECERYQRIWS